MGTDYVPDDIADAEPDYVTDYVPDDIADEEPDYVTDYVPDHIADEEPDYVPDHIADHIADYFTDPEMPQAELHELELRGLVRVLRRGGCRYVRKHPRVPGRWRRLVRVLPGRWEGLGRW